MRLELYDPEQNQKFVFDVDMETYRRITEENDMDLATRLLKQQMRQSQKYVLSEDEDEVEDTDTVNDNYHFEDEFVVEEMDEEPTTCLQENLSQSDSLCNETAQKRIKTVWSYEETIKLISCIESRYEDMHNPKKRKNFWTIISEDLISQGVIYDSTKCKKKWDNVTATYKDSKEKKKKTGRGPTRFLFFDQLDQILGDQPNHSSPHTIDVGNLPSCSGVQVTIPKSIGTALTPRSPSSSEPTSEATDAKDEDVPEKKVQKVKRKKTAGVEYVNIKKQYYTNKNENYSAYLTKMAKIEEEKVAILKKKLELEERKTKVLEKWAEEEKK